MHLIKILRRGWKMTQDLLHSMSHRGMTAYITHTACLGHNMGEGHPEGPERLAAIKDRLMAAQVFDFLNQVDAPEVNAMQLARVHPPKYIEYLEAVQPSVGTYRVDTDTAMNSGTLNAARHAAGAVVKAVDMVMNQQAPNAFCAIRPPGHHAETRRTMGFCFFNNIAIGAMHAIAEYGLERVAILDFDVHHGNGTEEIFKNDDRVMLLSLFQHPFFPYCGDKSIGNNPNIVNTPLKSGSKGDQVREVVASVWKSKLHQFKPQLILISAGFDGHLEDDMGNWGLVEADYKWITECIIDWANELCEGRIVSVLEGGYELSPLARSVAVHVQALAEA